MNKGQLSAGQTWFNIIVSIYLLFIPSPRPEQCQFREKWLKDIIENKIILMERLTL